MKCALTLWFTLTALLGPGVCCCSLAAAPLATTSQPAKADGAPKRAKSCCEHKLPAGAAKVDRAAEHAPTQGQPPKPGKCPCESEKQATSLPPEAVSAAPVEQLPSLDASPGDLAGSRPHLIAPFRFAPDAPAPLAGRSLLAAYSVLRC
jgi:hypothetical protein